MPRGSHVVQRIPCDAAFAFPDSDTYEFYRFFLSSLEGMAWVPQALVIGPQGVLDVVNMTGMLIKEFAGLKQVGARVNLQWVIYFPWVPDEGKFKGEVIYSIRQLENGTPHRKNV